jgi:Kef-type K+ transport system membrane component KefB
VVIAIVKTELSLVLYISLCGSALCYSHDLYCKAISKTGGDLWFKRHYYQTSCIFFFLVLIISSYATEVIGIHALFGAFMAEHYA